MELAFDAKVGNFLYKGNVKASVKADIKKTTKKSTQTTDAKYYTIGTMLPAKGKNLEEKLNAWVADRE